MAFIVIIKVVKLCREHGLYCALVYLFNRGLDDYRSPLEELLLVLRNSAGEDASVLGYVFSMLFLLLLAP